MKKRKKLTILILFTLFLSMIPLSITSDPVFANFEKGNRNPCLLSDGTTKDDSSSGNSSGGIEGEWTQEGTQAYLNAKAIFDRYTKTYGFSGASGAGIVGNAGNESGSKFNPFIIEIGSPSYQKLGAETKDARLVTGSVGTNGYGVFQISPGEKLGKWEGYKVEEDPARAIEVQMDYFWSGYGGAATQNGVKNNPNLKEMATASTPEQGTWLWFYNVEIARGTFESYDKKETREGFARTAYKLFGGENIKADSSLFTGIKDSDESGDKTNGDNANNKSSFCSTKSSNNSPKENIVEDALSLEGYFTYLQSHGVHLIGGDIKNPKKNGATDCSGFVWLVLARLGYNVPENMQWYTGAMAADAKGSKQWLEKVNDSDAKAGDIVIANVGSGTSDDGHTAILIEDYHGNDTQIIQSGGEGDGSISRGTIGNSFGSLLRGEVIFAKALKTNK